MFSDNQRLLPGPSPVATIGHLPTVDLCGQGLADRASLPTSKFSLPKTLQVLREFGREREVAGIEALDLIDDGSLAGASAGAASGDAVAASAARAAREVVIPPLLGELLPAVRPLLGAFAPLVAGERVVAALPAGVTVR